MSAEPKLSDLVPYGLTAGQYLALAMLCLDHAGARQRYQQDELRRACVELGVDAEGINGIDADEDPFVNYAAWLGSL